MKNHREWREWLMTIPELWPRDAADAAAIRATTGKGASVFLYTGCSHDEP